MLRLQTVEKEPFDLRASTHYETAVWSTCKHLRRQCFRCQTAILSFAVLDELVEILANTRWKSEVEIKSSTHLLYRWLRTSCNRYRGYASEGKNDILRGCTSEWGSASEFGNDQKIELILSGLLFKQQLVSVEGRILCLVCQSLANRLSIQPRIIGRFNEPKNRASI